MANTFNPYPELGVELVTGLTAIASTTTGISSVDDLVNAIYNYVQPIYYPSTTVPKALEIEIKSVVYNIIDAYNNKALGITVLYTPQQMNFVQMMLGSNASNNTPINYLQTWLADIEDNIGKANLSIEQQTPLLLGIQAEQAVNSYWLTEIDNSTSPWGPYFGSSIPDRNYMNVSFWTVACAEGALIGANCCNRGLIAPTTEIVSVNIVSALIGALAVGAGSVIFKWVPRVQPDQLLSKIVPLSKSEESNPGLGSDQNPLNAPPWWAFWASRKMTSTYNNCGDNNIKTYHADTLYDDKQRWRDDYNHGC